MAFRILIDETRIRNRIRELAGDLRDAYDDPLFVVVLDGARTFAQALLRALGKSGNAYEAVRVRSYEGTQSTGRHELVRDLNVDVHGRDIVLLEDIVDTGRTVRYLDDLLRERGARSVDVWTLLSKPSRRVVDVELRGIGFEIPDEFVIGYGLDFDGQYRELPHIAIWSADAEARRLQAGSTMHEGGATSG